MSLKTDFVCLVHYHEIGLKGRNRHLFERRLRENIQRSLGPELKAQVSRISGRLLIVLESWPDALAAAALVTKIPGVVRASCGFRCPQDLDEVCRVAALVFGLSEPFASFKVSARRANTNFAIDSMQLNQIIGGWLDEQFPEKLVQMREPDLKLCVEMVEGAAFVYGHTLRGIGGLPVGSAGHVVSLMSAGLDSPVATWRMIRRGATVSALHFSGRPETASTSEHLVRQLCELLNRVGGVSRLCIVAFGSYQRQLSGLVPSELRVIFYRRLMLAVANRLAELYAAKALVTGESLGQVASQTLDNIAAVDGVAAFPVFRPLIGTDKQEIVNESKALGSFEICSQSHEDCCTLFIPRNPETHAKLPKVEALWQTLPVDDWLEQIMAQLEVTEFGL